MATPEPGARPTRDAPAGVYVHLPFCARICPYCDFAVTTARAGEVARLLEALLAEIACRAPGLGTSVDTIYFGGGTPSLIEPGALAGVIEALRRHLRLEEGCRIYLEANPEDVAAATVAAWRELGVTTLSLGVQSLDRDALRFLGRRHSPIEARRAIEIAMTAGFETVSVDLIYARPGQTVAQWAAELEAVTELEPDHLSCYQLTVHESTPFGRLAAGGRLAQLPPPLQADALVATHQRLSALGWPAYEVSNFARSAAHRSRHNLKYWNGAPYLGLGPSAHSFVEPRRSWNVPDARQYVARLERGESVEEGSEELTPAERLLEEVMLGMRMVDGVDLARLERRYGVPLLAPNRGLIELWQASDRVRLDSGRLLPTLRGLAVADGLAGRLELPVMDPAKAG